MRNYTPYLRCKTTLILFALAVIGIAGVLLATSAGVGVSNDSIVYIDSARHLANGQGYVTKVECGVKAPVIMWPPLFPALLSILKIFGIDPLHGAKWFNAFFFGANVLLVGIILYNFTRGSFYIPILGSFLTLSSAVMLHIHSMAWTEPLFIFLGFLGLFLLTLHAQNKSRSYLIAGSAAIALAYLDRYIGNTLVVTGIIGILCLSQKKYYKRFIDSAIFVGISAFPMVLLSIRNYYLMGHIAGRRAKEPLTLGRLDSALTSVSSWLFPGSEIFNIFPAQDTVVRIFLIIAFSILLIISIRLLSKKTGRSNGKPVKIHIANTPFLFLIFLFVYVALLIAVIAFFDSNVPLDNRILSPAYVAALILVLYLLHKFFHSGIRRYLRVTLILAGAAFAVMYLATALVWITYSHLNGRQYTNKVWQGLEISKELEILSPETLIFSNYHGFIYFQTGRPACPVGFLNNIDIPGLAKLKNGHTDVVLVQFNIQPKYAFKNEFQYKTLTEIEIQKRFYLHPIVKRANILIYQISPKTKYR